MKIQCDVCAKAEASVFCTADEAALCAGCDHRVHHANKLASKHHRFSLLPPSSPKQFPLCDICQEKRAFLFCQQDRAILCRECDHPIHSANEHTQKHTRYLLTGLRLSATSEPYEPKSVPAVSEPAAKPGPPDTTTTTTTTTPFSISEYLIETLPGWHVEDLLDNHSSSTTFAFSKTDEASFGDCELENYSSNVNNSVNMGIWVPQAPSPLVYPSSDMGRGFAVGFKDSANNNNNATARRWSDDGSFTVPQINLPSVGSKRSRSFW